jgi:hypothetical protein
MSDTERTSDPGDDAEIAPWQADVKYPDVEVHLTGRNGNAFAIMGAVQGALRRAGVSKDELDAYVAESTSGDYDHLLRTAMKWVSVT